MPIRCACPPENCAGYRWEWSGFSPTRSISSRANARRPPAGGIPWYTSGAVTIRSTVCRGLSDENGSWNTTCTLVAEAGQRGPGGARSRPRPSNSTVPARRLQSAGPRSRAVVDFPLPDSPTIASVSPSSTSKLTSSTAVNVDLRRHRAFAAGDELLRHSTHLQQRLTHDTTSSSGIRARYGVQQHARVLVPRIREDLLGRAVLDRLARTHHQHPLAIELITARSCVMKTIPVAGGRLQLGQQLQDLRLHGDVERGGRLVRDEQRRASSTAPSRS